MKLQRNCRCSLCHRAYDIGCQEIERAMNEVDKVLSEVDCRAVRHEICLPPVEFYVRIPCWYSEAKWNKENNAA